MPQKKEELKETETFYNQLQDTVHKINKNSYILLSELNTRIGMLKSIILWEVLENTLQIPIDWK